MNVIDGRGLHTKEVAEKNKRAVKKWFKKNPNSTAKDCSKSLGLSYVTVRKHIKDLMDE